LSEEAAKATWLIALAVLLSQVSLSELGRGQCRSLGWGDHIRRERDPTYYWVAWSLWAGLAGVLWVVGLRDALGAYARRATAPSLTGDAWWFLVVALGLCMVLAWTWGRSGFPLAQFRRGRARWQQAERIRALTDDRETGMKDFSFDEFVDVADMEWLAEVELRLAVQPPPRNLAAAIDAKEDDDTEPAAG
jgi:hypothetical protein